MSWKAFLGRNLRSVKILACPTSPSSAAARTFWDSNYQSVKHLNPSFTFALRPAPELEPYMLVEYDYAYKVKVSLAGLDQQGIEKKLEEAVQTGDSMPRSAYQQTLVTQPSVIE